MIYERPPHRQFVAAAIWSAVVWLGFLGLLLLMLGCMVPKGPMVMPVSRTAMANPNCWSRCYVTVESVEGNATKGDLAPALSRQATISESTSETK